MVDHLEIPAVSDHLHVFAHPIQWDESAVARLAARINASCSNVVVLNLSPESFDPQQWYQRYLRLVDAISRRDRRIFVVYNNCRDIEDQLRVPQVTDVIIIDWWLCYLMQKIDNHEWCWNQQADQFLYLNGRDKPERFWLLHTMAQNDSCMRQSLYSYYPALTHSKVINMSWLHPEQKSLTVEHYDDFCHRWARNLDDRPRLDKGDILFNAEHLRHGLSVPQEWFHDTLFSLVVETTMACNKTPWITEKTYYAIANHRPFIIAGDCNSLARLESQGYCTFQEILPYGDYDSETDLISKFQKIRGNVAYLLEHKDRHADFLRQATQHNFEILGRSYRQTQQRIMEFIQKHNLDHDPDNLSACKHHCWTEMKWEIFYANIKAPHWPECTLIHQFEHLPAWIQNECLTHSWLLEFIRDTSKTNRNLPKKMLDAVQN